MGRWAGLGSEGDRGVVRGLHEEDVRALEKALAAYEGQVYDYAFALAGDMRAAEDIVHDAFVDALRRAARMRNPARLRAWLYAGVRRRALLRTRVRELAWAPQDTREGAPGEALEVLQGALDRISFSDQELVLLTGRHGFAGAELAAVLGEPVHRATARAARARRRAEAAVIAQLKVVQERCAGHLPVLVRAQNRAPRDDGHSARCPACRRRAEAGLAVLLSLPEPPRPPDSLRRRVLHTATDPELAGYRADIVGKGGHLTVEGFPRQPDTPSGLGRRWLIAGSGMAATLASAIAASLLLGPQLGRPPLGWPPIEQPIRSPAHPAPPERPVALPDVGGSSAEPTTTPEPSPADTGHAVNGGEPDVPLPTDTPNAATEPTASPAPPTSPDTPNAPPPPPAQVVPEAPQPPPALARLSVLDTEVAIGAGRTSRIPLQAENGPVTWTAEADNGAIRLGEDSGVVTPDQPYELEVRLPPSLIRLPGKTVVSIVNEADGSEYQVEVSWGLSLL